ncbi:hypothetical protein HNP40_001517 [Mycobacteroides chelonae]|nr:hypothetical protein [Mycobacteroides chelonae]
MKLFPGFPAFRLSRQIVLSWLVFVEEHVYEYRWSAGDFAVNTCEFPGEGLPHLLGDASRARCALIKRHTSYSLFSR